MLGNAGVIWNLASASSPLSAQQKRTTPVTSSITWTTANLAVFCPFVVPYAVTAYQMAVENGATLNGNIDVGIYDVLANRLVSSGSVAQAGASAIQTVDITNTLLEPGSYFMALVSDSTTATFFGSAAGDMTIQFLRSVGCQEQGTAFPLPDPAVFANPSRANMPSIAVALTAVI